MAWTVRYLLVRHLLLLMGLNTRYFQNVRPLCFNLYFLIDFLVPIIHHDLFYRIRA